jgi:membrane associated rhomboid family serine protease
MPRYPSRQSPPSSFSFGPGPLSATLKAIIAINVIVFVATEYMYEPLKLTLGFVPPLAVNGLQIWRFVTYMFVHGDVFHILFNMLALWMFGTELERIWGTRFFLKFYFIVGAGSAMITALVSYVPYPALQALAFSNIVGASGAIYGLLLAYALYFPDRVIYYIVFPLRVRVYVAISGALAFYASLSANGGGVASATHLGGLLVAYVYLTLLRKGPRIQFNPWAEVKYRYVKWQLAKARRKFDVYSGGRGNTPDRWDGRVH